MFDLVIIENRAVEYEAPAQHIFDLEFKIILRSLQTKDDFEYFLNNL